MRLHIVDRNELLDAESRELAERRLRFALTRFDAELDRVVLTLQDENGGQKGGIDKSCRLAVYLRSGDAVTVSDVDATVVAAVSRVAERAARTVARTIERRREKSGSPSMAG